jgi:hypothetical protein
MDYRLPVVSLALVAAALLPSPEFGPSDKCADALGSAEVNAFDIADCNRLAQRWTPSSSLSRRLVAHPRTSNNALSLVFWRRCTTTAWSPLANGLATMLGGGRLTGSACNPAALPALTDVAVLNAIKRIKLPRPTVGVPRYTLVNLETTFYTRAEPFTRQFPLLGRQVTARVTPETYTWTWGDGDYTTTDQPGEPYPSKDVTHTYLHRTQGDNQMHVHVSVEYSCEYQVANGTWQQIPDTITIDGPPSAFPIKEASAVLVPN